MIEQGGAGDVNGSEPHDQGPEHGADKSDHGIQAAKDEDTEGNAREECVREGTDDEGVFSEHNQRAEGAVTEPDEDACEQGALIKAVLEEIKHERPPVPGRTLHAGRLG